MKLKYFIIAVLSALSNSFHPLYSTPQVVNYELNGKLLERKQIATSIKASLQIVNAGIPGNNSSDLLKRFDQEINQAKPDLAIIMVGTNDMLNTKNLVTYSNYRSNLRTMVTRLKAKGIKPLLICPPPADTTYLYERHDRKAYAEMPNEKMDSVRNIIKELAVENNCGYVDVYDAFVKLNVPKHNSDDYIRNEINSNARDGVHPTPKGYDLIAKAVFNYLITTKTVFSGMKIICLGDSITNGVHVKGAGTAIGETYPGVLYRLLDIYIQKN